MNHPSQSGASVPIGPPGIPLRKLLRSKATKAFLTESGTWTNDISTAAVFVDLPAAAAAKSHFALDEVELYYSFNGLHRSEYDFAVSL